MALTVTSLSFGCTLATPDPADWTHGTELMPYVQSLDVGATYETLASPSDVVDMPGTFSETNEILPAEDYARAQLTREELAMAVRPLTLGPDGRTYVGKNPNWELADKILGMSEDVALQFDGEAALLPGLDKAVQFIFGSDNRTIPANAAPHNQVLHFSNNCSGVYIGHRTIITAAHCVFNPVNNTWKLPITVTPMKQGGAAPYGTHSLAHPVHSTGVTIPTAFDDNTADGDPRWDYAVVDLTGHATSPTGWNGFIVNYSSSSLKLFGYPRGLFPGEVNEQVKLCPGKTTAGWQCGMSGTGYVSDYRLESSNVDATNGQSGGPWLAGTNHTVGVHTGWRTYPDFFECGLDVCRRNYGRRLDSTFWSAVQSWSSEW